MNIFYLHDNPRTAAEYQCDKHVVKMVLETAQLLSTAHHISGSPHASALYKATHKNHPSAVWVRENKGNYLWALEHLKSLLSEYTYRYNKVHKTARLIPILENVPDISDDEMTEPPQCMYDDCRHPDVVHAYRTYYAERMGEIDMRWTKRSKPTWLEAA